MHTYDTKEKDDDVQELNVNRAPQNRFAQKRSWRDAPIPVQGKKKGAAKRLTRNNSQIQTKKETVEQETDNNATTAENTTDIAPTENTPSVENTSEKQEEVQKKGVVNNTPKTVTTPITTTATGDDTGNEDSGGGKDPIVDNAPVVTIPTDVQAQSIEQTEIAIQSSSIGIGNYLRTITTPIIQQGSNKIKGLGTAKAKTKPASHKVSESQKAAKEPRKKGQATARKSHITHLNKKKKPVVGM